MFDLKFAHKKTQLLLMSHFLGYRNFYDKARKARRANEENEKMWRIVKRGFRSVWRIDGSVRLDNCPFQL